MPTDFSSLWAGRSTWTMLQTGCTTGSRFLEVFAQWQAQANAPRMLHYVALAESAETFSPAFIAALCATVPPTQAPPLYRGFNRLLLAGGRVSLTLCIGPVPTLLRGLRLQADRVWASAAAPWETSDWKQVALQCKVGAHVFYPQSWQVSGTRCAPQGFQPLAPTHPTVPGVAAVEYQPRWTPQQSRRLLCAPATPARCAVIGAGLSGAAVAHALALRGWHVTVYDHHPQPTSGASGLPAGLCVPVHSQDNNPQSRLTQQGVRICLAHAHARLEAGQDWSPCGVVEIAKPDSPAPTRHHAHAGWVKPAALVAAWLRHPRIQWAGNSTVQHLHREASQWRLEGVDERLLGHADLVVLANAQDSAVLAQSVSAGVHWAPNALDHLRALHAVYGSVSSGLEDTQKASFAMHGSGSWIGGIPTASGTRWYAGATFEKYPSELSHVAAQHAANLARVCGLSADLARTMAQALAEKKLHLWQGARCVTHDRLPLVGPLEAGPSPGLWICAGMGSRGLSLAALCAELLAAYLHAEPLPLDPALARSLCVQRPRKGRAES